jgi:hypothetical protein
MTLPPRRSFTLLVVVVGLSVLVTWPLVHAALSRLLGPPGVELRERYGPGEPGRRVDHATFDGLLRAVVRDDGRVDYARLRADPAPLDAYLAMLREVEFAPLGRDEKLALLINAYNAFTLRLVLDHWPLRSIRDIPEAERWDADRWRIGELTLSLTEIEHDLLRANFREPRIHFAINCASIGCPPLRREAYRTADLESQLEDQTRRVHGDPRFVRFGPGAELRLTRIYEWYRGDFEQVAGSIVTYAAKYTPSLAAALEQGVRPALVWFDYDWNLNGIAAAEPR